MAPGQSLPSSSLAVAAVSPFSTMPRSVSRAGCPAYLTIPVRSRITGKTSFLRLLLDTCNISPNVTKDQLTSLAKFVQGCGSHTSFIRSATIDVEVDTDDGTKPLGLTLIDTPSLDFSDDQAAERLMLETLHHVDSRFAEGIGLPEVSARHCLLSRSTVDTTPLLPQGRKNPGFRYVHLYVARPIDPIYSVF